MSGSKSRRPMGLDVFTAAYDRLFTLYERGDRIGVSISGGKDSTCVMEMAILAARDAGRLPVDVVMRDEEVMYPGTFEYLRRVAERTDEVRFQWMIAGQPIVNAFNRFEPYWWTFDPLCEDRWVRSYPGHGDEPQLPGLEAFRVPAQHIGYISSVDTLPLGGLVGWDDWDDLTRDEILKRIRTEEGRDTPRARLMTCMGLRVEESRARYMGLLSSEGYITKAPTEWGGYKCRPIYDWTTSDVWRFIKEHDLDYNHSYDVMARMGIAAKDQRVGPPTLNAASIGKLKMASQAWPQWWSKVCNRIEGLRTAAKFGKRAVSLLKRDGETWQQAVEREMLDPDKVPAWLYERVRLIVDRALSRHAHHSSHPLPDSASCAQCLGYHSSWANIAKNYYNGDPFGMKGQLAGAAVEPEFFREGAGNWNGPPTW